jgi:hypothetical protein
MLLKEYAIVISIYNPVSIDNFDNKTHNRYIDG